MNIILCDYESVWPKNKCRSPWPIFCLISLRLFDVWTSYFGLTSQHDLTFDLKINVGHCDPYFMVQWFCLISWRLFHVWTSYFGFMSQYDTTFDLKPCRSLWPIFHGPLIMPYILKTIWYMNTILWDYELVWTDVWPQNICRTPWPIFQSSNFALNLENFSVAEHHNFGSILWVNMDWRLSSKYLYVNSHFLKKIIIANLDCWI